MAAGDIVVISENADGRKGNYFDGTDDYVLHDAHAVARVAANDTVGTYSAWIYLDNVTNTYCILSAGDNDSTNESLQFYMGTTGKLAVRLYHGGVEQFNVVQTTASMEARKWHHVAVVQNGTQPALYIDGSNIAVTNAVSTDLTYWYDELSLCDKFAIGILESNATHTVDFKGAIGRVRYWSIALSAEEIKNDYKDATQPNATVLDAALQFNITMTDDGTTDSGLGADNGTLTGNAYYGGLISDWSYKLNTYSSVTGHAAEFITTFPSGANFVSIIKKGD